MASLLVVDAGIAHEIPPDGLTIGRGRECGIVLDCPEVSRLHARVVERDARYTISDESTNGIFVNGERVDGSHRLTEGDVIRIGDAVFRFGTGGVIDPRSVVPARSPDADAPATSGSVETTPLPRRRRPEVAPSVLLATLDVVEGNVPQGMRFRIERPVAQIGRGAASDVCLLDQSVSGSHATLMRRGGTWYLLDHSSANGTYVDGVRVNQCALPGPCDLRLGGVTLRFRPVPA